MAANLLIGSTDPEQYVRTNRYEAVRFFRHSPRHALSVGRTRRRRRHARLLTGATQPVPSGPLTAATVTITNTVTGVGPGTTTVMGMGGFDTKKAAVNTALAEYAKLLKRRELLKMQGKIPWVGDLDSLRADRTKRQP